jgi:flagellin-specific chaperone FliS
MTKKTLQRIQTLLDKVSDGIEEYACTLESTDVIRDPLDKIYDIIEKELNKK